MKVKHKISATAEMVPHSNIRKMFNIASTMVNVINFGIGEPDFNTPSNIIEAAKKAMDEGYTHYTANAGLIELRKALAVKLERDNRIQVNPENNIIVTSGAMGALSLSMLTLVNREDEVLLPQPSWCNYEAHIILAGGCPVYVPLKEENKFELQAEDIKKKITSKTKLLIINSPNNPTGSVTSYDEMKKIAKVIEENGLYVISDEVYEKFVYDGTTHVSPASFSEIKDRVIVINSFSKSYAMTGWRLGFAAGNSLIIDEMIKLQEHTVACANAISQKAAIEALEGSQDSLEQMVKQYKLRRDILVSGLASIDGIKCIKPKGSFYIFANIKELCRFSEEFALDLLKKAKVCLIPGTAFGEEGEGFVRISYVTSKEKIIDGLERIKKYVQSIK